jgi:hypothetical protein
VNLDNEVSKVTVPSDGLAFTYCQVPIVYRRASEVSMVIETQDGTEQINGTTLSKELTSELFRRTGNIKQITVSVVK